MRYHRLRPVKLTAELLVNEIRQLEAEYDQRVYLEIPNWLNVDVTPWTNCRALLPALPKGQIQDCHVDVGKRDRLHLHVMPNGSLRFHVDRQDPLDHLFQDTKIGTGGIVGAIIGGILAGSQGAALGAAIGGLAGAAQTGTDWLKLRATAWHRDYRPNVINTDLEVMFQELFT